MSDYEILESFTSKGKTSPYEWLPGNPQQGRG